MAGAAPHSGLQICMCPLHPAGASMPCTQCAARNAQRRRPLEPYVDRPRARPSACAGRTHADLTRQRQRRPRWQAAADREWRAKERAEGARLAGIHADLSAARTAQAAEKAATAAAAAAAGAAEAAAAAAAAAAARAEREGQVGRRVLVSVMGQLRVGWQSFLLRARRRIPTVAF